MSFRRSDPGRDEAFMRAAIALARRGLGRTWPNPSVAALVVDETAATPRVLGRGRTAPGGRPHAEALAIAAAGVAARGATMYVTLEPCAQRSQRVFGPSCTEIILESGIARVVIGAPDPSPFAGGEGAQRLRDAGVEVVTGVLESEAREITSGHCLRVSAHRPHVRVKLAETADGFAGTLAGGPLAITGEEARAAVHRMRASVDCLITGIGTVLADDPRLDVRLPGMEAMSPLRVVLDTDGRMPETARMLLNPHASTLIRTAKDRSQDLTTPSQSVEFTYIPPGEGHHIDLKTALAALAARGMTRAMVEAGPTLAAAFAAAGLVDELALFTSPSAVGEGLPALLPPLAGWRDKAQLVEERMIGADHFRLYRKA
jgi:diaminohydroxyphosphoribosylaminopyrimidine deaminase/5-amino-6-(5-phosphoribosylamino)uracil reductase